MHFRDVLVRHFAHQCPGDQTQPARVSGSSGLSSTREQKESGSRQDAALKVGKLPSAEGNRHPANTARRMTPPPSPYFTSSQPAPLKRCICMEVTTHLRRNQVAAGLAFFTRCDLWAGLCSVTGRRRVGALARSSSDGLKNTRQPGESWDLFLTMQTMTRSTSGISGPHSRNASPVQACC
jgi:hypothetical protein